MQLFRGFVNSFSITDKKWHTIAWLKVLSFTINEDALAKATSTFDVIDVPDNISIGDVIRVNMPNGTRLFVGVIDKIDGTTITASQGAALLKGQWIYNPYMSGGLYSSITETIYRYMTGTFYNSTTIDSLNASRFSRNKFKALSLAQLQSQGGEIIEKNYLQHEEDKTIDFEDYIYSLFEDYQVGLLTSADISKGTDTADKVWQQIVIAKNSENSTDTSFTPLVISDNSRYVSNAEVVSTTQETNRLVVYSNDKVLRQVYYATPEGVTTNANDPLRIFPVVTAIVFSDDDLESIKEANIQPKTFNHQLKFDIEFGNPYYKNMNSWNAGTPLTVSIQNHVFDTIITGWTLTKEPNSNLTKITFICGKARTSLTKKLLAQGVI